jgi:hypothetical protein
MSNELYPFFYQKIKEIKIDKKKPKSNLNTFYNDKKLYLNYNKPVLIFFNAKVI